MNFLKALFGGKKEPAETPKKTENDKNFDILKYDGVRALRANQAAYAVQCLTHALQIKDDLETHDYLSQAYLRTDNTQKAYEQLQILADARPDNLQILIRMAHVAFIMEDYEAMKNVCEKALALDDKSPEVLWLSAKANIGQGDSTSAIALLTRALESKPDFSDARLLRGETLLSAGKAEEADLDATELLKATEDNEDVLLLKARIERAEGNPPEAIKYYNKVSDANPFRIEAYSERAEMLRATGDEAGAREDDEKAAELASQQTADNENLENEVKQAYRNNDPYGIFSNS